MTEIERQALDPLVACLDNPALLEILAEIEHARWSGWEQYRQSTNQLRTETETFEERWLRQSLTPYAGLSEREKESDRIEARKGLAAIRKFVSDCLIAEREAR